MRKKKTPQTLHFCCPLFLFPLFVAATVFSFRISLFVSNTDGMNCDWKTKKRTNTLVKLATKRRTLSESKLRAEKCGTILDVFVSHSNRKMKKLAATSSTEKIYKDIVDGDISLLYEVMVVVKERRRDEQTGKYSSVAVEKKASDFLRQTARNKKAVAVKALKEAKIAFMKTAYDIRSRKNENCHHVFDFYWKDGPDNDFVVCSYDNNHHVLAKRLHGVCIHNGKEISVGFPELSALRCGRVKGTQKAIKEAKVDPFIVLTNESDFVSPRLKAMLLQASASAAETFYIVSFGAGACRSGTTITRKISDAFPQLRLECLFFDDRFRMTRKNGNSYEGFTHTICPSSIALNRSKLGVFEEMKEIESDASRNVLFKFYKLNYHDDYTFNFHCLSGKVLAALLSPDCAGFSKSNTKKRKRGDAKANFAYALNGVYQCLSFAIACAPLFYVLESCGSEHKRRLRNQPMMASMCDDSILQTYSQCKLEGGEGVQKHTDTFSNGTLCSDCCTAASPCPHYLRHTDSSKLSRERLALWPKALDDLVCEAIIKKMGRLYDLTKDSM